MIVNPYAIAVHIAATTLPRRRARTGIPWSAIIVLCVVGLLFAVR